MKKQPDEASTGRRPHTFPRGLLISALLVIVLWGIAAAQSFLIPVCLAALLAFLMNPLVRGLKKRRVPLWVSVTISYFLLVLPLLAFLSFTVVEMQALVKDFPK